MSGYLLPWEITSVCADFLVELRGFEPRTPQCGHQRVDGAALSDCAYAASPPHPARLALLHLTYARPAGRDIAGFDENRGCPHPFIASDDNTDVERVELDPATDAPGLVGGDDGRAGAVGLHEPPERSRGVLLLKQ
jgi:hypothetical protein